MQARLAVRRAFEHAESVETTALLSGADAPLVLVALSGGSDSLALAAATAALAREPGTFRAGAVIVDHALQPGSAEVAGHAASIATGLGLEPVRIQRVSVGGSGGPEAAARDARYAALKSVASELGAKVVLTAHTRDDQAEQVLLALTRGSGTRSISGIPLIRESGDGLRIIRPFLIGAPEITRETTDAVCGELGIAPWRDPHNKNPEFARVRVRETVLPVLAGELGAGVVSGLARSADLAREDADALDLWALRVCEQTLRQQDEGGAGQPERWLDAAAVAELRELPAAVRQRVIHLVAAREFSVQLTREHTLAIAALITDWRGQGPIFVPGIRVTRELGELHFARQIGSPRR